MKDSNDRLRIVQLEQALQDCIAVLKALPANNVVWGQAKKAQEVLDSAPSNQPLFAIRTINPPGDSSIEKALELRVIVGPKAEYVNISADGDWEATQRYLHFALQRSPMFHGLHLPLAANTTLASVYADTIAAWDKRGQLNVSDSIAIDRP